MNFEHQICERTLELLYIGPETEAGLCLASNFILNI